jgi:plasmid stabilization system protein ParE
VIARLTTGAVRDLEQIADYYRSVNPSLADGFAVDVQEQLRLLSEHPDSGSRLQRGYRRTLLRRFPFALIYRIDLQAQHIQVVALIDQRRRPETWLGRLEEARAVYILPSMAA